MYKLKPSLTAFFHLSSMVFPTDIALHAKSRTLEISFDNGFHVVFPAEFLRVYSPSAEVRGHAPGEAKLQVGKQDVSILEANPVGNYALQLVFSDGHNSGVYSWDYFLDIGHRIDDLWQGYLVRLQQAGKSRDPKAACNRQEAATHRFPCRGRCH